MVLAAGISERDLVSALGYCSVQSATDLLRTMTKHGLLKTATIAAASASSLIPGCLLKHLPKAKTADETVYFANAPFCFAQTLPVLDPADL